MTLCISDTHHSKTTVCRILFIVMLNAIMLSVVKLNIVMLSVVWPFKENLNI
jgi:hypothetical protein